MTDKERLEAIKFRLTFGSMNLCNAPRLSGFESPFEIVQKEDLLFLIEQADTALKCDAVYDDLVREYDLLLEENKRYREATMKIEKCWKKEFENNPNEYQSGRLDGLDVALGIIEGALEG